MISFTVQDLKEVRKTEGSTRYDRYCGSPCLHLEFYVAEAEPQQTVAVVLWGLEAEQVAELGQRLCELAEGMKAREAAEVDEQFADVLEPQMAVSS